ncbi:MAG: alpha/beta fold hydrolase [Anaerolineae bacterium]
MPQVKIGGETIYYVHRRPVPAGQPPVVFVHGAGGTHQHWLYQVRDLNAPNQGDLPPSPTYALDLPGHGRSEGTGHESIQAYGDWLRAFLDAVDLHHAVLVGHSMGGAIALDMALRYPQRVAGLGLVATGARLPVAPAILEGILTEPQAAVRLICDWAFGPEAPEELVRLGRRQMGQVPARVLYGDFVACDAFDVRPSLDGISAPTLVLCGTRDRMTPVKYSTYLRDHISGTVLHLVEGAGHMVMIERPQALVRALAAFVGRLPA